MSLSIGIVGLPNVGKSTLFNALTNASVPADNYPFCTIDPSVGIVAVPDTRLEVLSKISGSKKIIPAAIEFVDIAGLVKGAAEGAGLGNQFLAHIRETDAIAEVVRIFEDDNMIHVEGGVNPLRDIEIINMELILADMATCEKRIQTLGRDVKRGDKEAIAKDAVIQKIYATLKEEKLAHTATLSVDELALARDLHLITMKPFLYVLNKKAGGRNLDEMNDARYTDLIAYLTQEKKQYVLVDARIESELREFEGEEKDVMRGELGAHDDGITALITGAYATLGLSSYLTTGEMETRAWTFKTGSSAPKAAAAIHTDFEKKFIRAEVVAYTDLAQAGTFAAAKSQGNVRAEGKDYVVQDGDVIEFLIS